ncbi:hypothetical protein PPL_01721 [Heterostelium album PN500]|uniref:NTF2 domain-containing protein n=1 Tax=Heterostelium pallidum (strain ATCC 26659 / Pp 5 / PN500) TaxID=670386 RepID=D3B0A5_HETP5|nr:hypothetical protein PPL_01721 [Heterostelium album PN500]EFA84729.1 hypothetical protein PPL_01721 [Heterostelium album PN500]|eukprot:XP_020436841.1 hypothetical protein PPL_01721 [Heterostelium album PN500]
MFNITSTTSTNGKDKDKEEANFKKQMDNVYLTSQTAEAFVKDNYYNFLDNDRSKLLRLYKENSMVLWNGTELRGLEKIEGLYRELPPTVHKVECYDAQYILGTNQQVTSMMITVSGKVTLAGQVTHQFQQTLVLTKDPVNQNFYLGNDCMRLTSTCT